MLTLVLAAAIVGTLLIAGIAFHSLNEGYLKWYFLTHRTLTTGYWTSAVVWAASLLFLTVLGAFFGQYGVLIGFVSGLFAGTWLAVFFWNEGIRRVPLKHRAVPVWRGKRQSDPKLEMGEKKYWLFPWFFDFDAFEIKEYTDAVIGIPIEVGDENTVPTDITLQWEPRAGQLFYFGNLDDPKGAFEAEMKGVARAFGISRKDIDSIIDENYPELLKAATLEHLQRRANGEVNSITIDPKSGEAKFTPLPGQAANPWGIRFVSASVPNFTIPQGISEAAEEKTEAQKRAEASEVEQTAIDKIVDLLVSKHSINQTVAASMAMAMVMPKDRQPNVQTVNHTIGGLDEFARTVINGILVGIGKEPLPGMTLTPPVTANPQQPAPTSATPASS